MKNTFFLKHSRKIRLFLIAAALLINLYLSIFSESSNKLPELSLIFLTLLLLIDSIVDKNK